MVRVKESVDIQMPLEVCYKAWADVSSYPSFIPGLKTIRPKGGPDVWHWEMEGPEGVMMEWDTQMDALKHHNRMVSWHTVRNADLPHAGAVTFQPIDAPGGGTRMQLVVDCEGENTPAFDQFMRDCVHETVTGFKSYIEKQPIPSQVYPD